MQNNRITMQTKTIAAVWARLICAIFLLVVFGAPQCPHDQCVSNDNCLPDFYCKKEPGQCEGLGACTERPEACAEIYSPVCGCDEHTYGNECEAAAAGVTVIANGTCDEIFCDTADCGPALGMPNYLCPDGTTGGPTGRCLRNADGSCGWEIRECANNK